MQLPTVTIETENGPVIINESDYDPAKHTLLSGTALSTPAMPPLDANGLRLDGPTVTEFVAAGYLPTDYPPEGYASRSTPEEIATAIAATTAPATTAPEQLLVTKKGKKFIAVNAAGEAVQRDGIAAGGYDSEADAWAAIMALSVTG